MNRARSSAWPWFASKYSGAFSSIDRRADPAWLASGRRNAPIAADRKLRNFGYQRILERALEADAELELTRATAESIVMDRNAVVQPQRPDRQVQSQADAPVIAVTRRIPQVRIEVDLAHVIEHREPQVLDHRHAVFSRPEPVSVTANRFLRSGGRVARTHRAITETAQCINAAQIITIVERHQVSPAIRIHHTRAAEQLKHVPGEKAVEVPMGLQIQFVIIFFPAERTGKFQRRFSALALVGEHRTVASVPGQ